LVTLVFSATLFRSNMLRRKANEELSLQKATLENLNEEITQQNQSINLQKAELERTDLLKNRLLSIISHDVRTPLSNLHAMVDLYKSEAISESEFKEWAGKIDLQIEKTSEFLNDLLYWAKAQVQHHEIPREPVNVKAVVDNNLLLLRPQLIEKNLDVTCRVRETYCVMADKNIVNLVIKNLLSNAVKFTRRGGSITVDAERKSGLLQISVQDTGVGMDEKTAALIFTNTAQQNSTLGTGGEKGTGIGLAFCKDFVESQGGTIGVISNRNSGSTFYFTLPLAES
jgi:two-component system sensor histidine kinase/response regulator